MPDIGTCFFLVKGNEVVANRDSLTQSSVAGSSEDLIELDLPDEEDVDQLAVVESMLESTRISSISSLVRRWASSMMMSRRF